MKVWPFRRSVQAAVIVLTLGFPVLAKYGHYLAARQLDDLTEDWKGTAPGYLMKAADKAMRLGLPDGEGGVALRRPRKAVLKRTRDFNGSPWSATLFGWSLTDLLAAAESASASRALRPVLLTGALLPLAATLLLGRVYCGWICPMGLIAPLARRLRRFLEFLEIKPLSGSLDSRDKYCVLAAGLAYGLLFGLPVLHYLYPPAIFGREAHGLVSAYFDGAEAGRIALWSRGLSSASLFLLLILALEVFVLPGFWCRSLCPGGALYSLLSRFRLLRVLRDPSACTDCTLCDLRCPMGLAPMADKIGPECDACGVCVDACPTDALRYGWRRGGIPKGKKPKNSRSGKAALAAVLCALALPAYGHHIMGIPHYAYDENYPQTPVIKLVETLGDWEIQLTGYPGHPTPGVRTEVHVYALHSKTGRPYLAPIRLEAWRLPPFGGKERIYGPMEGRPDDNLHKYYPTYPENGNYEIRLSLEDGARTDRLSFAMTVGTPPSPWRTVALFAGFIVALLVVVRAIRIKRKRQLEKKT